MRMFPSGISCKDSILDDSQSVHVVVLLVFYYGKYLGSRTGLRD
jgi:hypothetical protein